MIYCNIHACWIWCIFSETGIFELCVVLYNVKKHLVNLKELQISLDPGLTSRPALALLQCVASALEKSNIDSVVSFPIAKFIYILNNQFVVAFIRGPSFAQRPYIHIYSCSIHQLTKYCILLKIFFYFCILNGTWYKSVNYSVKVSEKRNHKENENYRHM